MEHESFLQKKKIPKKKTKKNQKNLFKEKDEEVGNHVLEVEHKNQPHQKVEEKSKDRPKEDEVGSRLPLSALKNIHEGSQAKS